MNKIMLCIFVMFLISCAPPKHPIIIDSSLQPYVDSFAAQYRAEYGHDMSVDFSASYDVIQPNSLGLVLGQCITDAFGNKTIVINSKTWTSFEELDREQLMYHEMGHCVLHRPHDNGLAYNVDRSMMNAYHIPEPIYKFYHDKYIHELFHVGEF